MKEIRLPHTGNCYNLIPSIFNCFILHFIFLVLMWILFTFQVEHNYFLHFALYFRSSNELISIKIKTLKSNRRRISQSKWLPWLYCFLAWLRLEIQFLCKQYVFNKAFIISAQTFFSWTLKWNAYRSFWNDWN